MLIVRSIGDHRLSNQVDDRQANYLYQVPFRLTPPAPTPSWPSPDVIQPFVRHGYGLIRCGSLTAASKSGGRRIRTHVIGDPKIGPGWLVGSDAGQWPAR
jgi:hypothetical protein